jgi:hypothetical protein
VVEEVGWSGFLVINSSVRHVVRVENQFPLLQYEWMQLAY